MFPRELRQYSNRKLFIALGAMIALALVATAATVIITSALVSYRAQAQNHNDNRIQLQALLTRLDDAETNQRGYLLTGSDVNYQAYLSAAEDIPIRYRRLALGENVLNNRTDFTALKGMLSQKLGELKQTVELYKAGNIADAMAIVQSGSGQQVGDNIRGRITQIQDDEAALLAKDRQRVTFLATLARDISIVTLLISLPLAGLVYWLYLKAIQSERRLDRAKDEFVSLASHQLRTPATGIKSILSMLVAGDFGHLNDRQEHFMRRALESNERELGIIEELLNVAKADAGRLVLHAAEFELESLITVIVNEQRPAIEEKKQSVKIQAPSQPLRIVADEEKLYMAIGNLVDNARKYTPESGSISVTISVRRGEAYVEVSDSGIGIGPDELSHVFDRFQRASDAVRGNVEGAGLGLYLARRIAELHDGTIEVSSKLGKGTKFVMILPRGDISATQSHVS